MVSDLIAIGALVVGLLNSLWQARVYRQKKDMENAAQAQDVEFVATPTSGEFAGIMMAVTNNSDKPIFDVILSSDDSVSASAGNGSKLSPGQSLEWPARRFSDGRVPLFDGELLNAHPEVRFRDTHGRRWLRRPDMTLVNLDKRRYRQLREIPWRQSAPPKFVPEDIPHGGPPRTLNQ